jgi:hypothetical protein
MADTRQGQQTTAHNDAPRMKAESDLGKPMGRQTGLRTVTPRRLPRHLDRCLRCPPVRRERDRAIGPQLPGQDVLLRDPDTPLEWGVAAQWLSVGVDAPFEGLPIGEDGTIKGTYTTTDDSGTKTWTWTWEFHPVSG